MYTDTNFRTKKELKLALEEGKEITIFQPGPFGGTVPQNGTVYLEGPHFPEPHKWYAQGTMQNGKLIKIK